MEDFKPNSNKFKEERREASQEKKEIKKVVNGQAKVRKKSEVRKFMDIFISDDIHNVRSYVKNDVLIPAIKKALSDIITNGIDMILYGESGRSKKSSSSRISYSSYYDRRDEDRRRERDRGLPAARYDYDDVSVDTRGEAEEVLTRMDELIETYGVVSVADFYDLVGVTGQYTDNKYGWTNIRNASVVRVRDGYKIKLPKAMPIN